MCSVGASPTPVKQNLLTPLQQRFFKLGFEGLDDQEVIELLLSQCCPRGSKKLAKQCIDRFKNLRGFLMASPQDLERAGITPPGMLCIKILHELPAEVLKQKIFKRPIQSSSGEVFNYLYYSMRDLRNEVFKVLYLNNRNQIIDTVDLFEGDVDSIPIRPRGIVQSAIEREATRLIITHNHPAGDPAPSKSDKQLTRDLVFIGMVLQIKILDHVIIGDNVYYSFADEGLIEKYEDSFLNLRIRGMFGRRVAHHEDVPEFSTLRSN